jgi:nucleoside-diphosphate-sugar epimerase
MRAIAPIIIHQMVNTLPQRFAGVAELEEFMTQPTPELERELQGLDGDIIVLGVGGKMGPTLARMAKRAAPGKRVIGVARFSERNLKQKLEAHGVECIACDLLDRAALEKLPRAKNVVFMAGHKFGAADNAALTWAMNVNVPFMVAEAFRSSRIVVFSTACVYPYVSVETSGAKEETATLPPAGDYANSCVGREQAFSYGSQRHGTPGRLVRLEYAIDMRYGVLHDVAAKVFAAQPVDVTMGHVNVIWQGEANEQALRLLTRCTSPTSPINVSGPQVVAVRDLAQAFGAHFKKKPLITGQEATTAWLVDTSAAQQMFGKPRVPLERMIEWQADWIARGAPSLGKPTHFETRDGKY